VQNISRSRSDRQSHLLILQRNVVQRDRRAAVFVQRDARFYTGSRDVRSGIVM